MIDWLKAIQLKARYLFGIFIFGCVILLLPDNIADKFGFLEIRKVYRGWIGLATIGSFSFWLIQLAPSILSIRANKAKRKTVLEHIHSLSQNEMLIVAYCLYKNQNTISLPMTNSAASALCHKGLMVRALQGSTLKMPYTFQPFVWDHLQSIKCNIIPRDIKNHPNILINFEQFENLMRMNDIDLML